MAKFVIEDFRQFQNEHLYCKGPNELLSPNKVVIERVSADYFISEWSEWSKCNDVNTKELVVRTRHMAKGNLYSESRYCRCNDLKQLPSPRYL